ncbi:hypothetical protein ACP70R_019040 [Stipagrostis hirtigluma subsp. patula]
MPRRRPPAPPLIPVLLLVLVVVAAAPAVEAEEESVPGMELYFSAAELARIAGYGEEPVSSVSVSGQVACELCLRPGDHLLAFNMPASTIVLDENLTIHSPPNFETPVVHQLRHGAKVAVSCKTDEGTNQVANAVFATTDEYGNFTIDLPSQLHATPNLEKACVVKVLQLPVDSCRLHHRPSSTYGLRLSSQEDGFRAYTTGVIRLQNSDTPSEKCVTVENSERR